MQDLGQCVEQSVELAPVANMVGIMDQDETTYEVSKWDDSGLVANATDNCQVHILTMEFESGAVAMSDIPTHAKDCEAFTVTNSYRLRRGHYWVDTSPNNDFDKPARSTQK